ncbi:MAG: CocE/NonD family hydrolase [Verrucomicrobia bacterium]|nr:CocE/NonD family hydrolase [Verrucomicrobiota bacterium]
MCGACLVGQVTPPASPAGTTSPASAATSVRENYSKYDYRIPMRDGVRLFTSVYVPKDFQTDGKTYPIMLQRTPYSVRPYGVDQFPASLGPSELYARDKFIFVYQDVRGRYMSEGEFTLTRPYKPIKNGPKDTDETSDAYDTIDWLVKNVPGNSGKVGMWGVSQPGFFVSAAMIDAHPALIAVSPQAPVTDYYLGDDSYHNGAFMLAHRFRFYQGFKQREGDPSPPPPPPPGVDLGTPDGYEFFLNLGSLANAEEKYFKRQQPFWTAHMENTSYTEFWKSRSIWRHFKGIKPAVLTVGGWFDQEDPMGPLRTFKEVEKNAPVGRNMLVMGPWTHGGFARGDGDRVGNVNFGSKTGQFYREKIEFPFFLHFLKGKGDSSLSKAWVFETGVNQWRRFDAWPPRQSVVRKMFLSGEGKLSMESAPPPGFEEYIADPNRPVPYLAHVSMAVRPDYMTEDQRFAATRPDVLVFKTEPLEGDVTLMGPIGVDLKVSTTGTDADFVVKLIDVYPGDYPDFNAAPAVAGAPARLEPANAIKMGSYQQLVRGEPFRGKYRQSFEQPVPFVPGQPERITFELPDVAHTFRRGHRIMVQVQSSWFPLTDRNPQKFMDIPNARATDFQKATQRVFIGGADGSRLDLRVLE